MSETNTTASTATALEPIEGATLTVAPKPGWRTSEFYKGLVVIALVTLLSSGVIPTTGIGAQIAAIAGLVLTFLGYTGARTWLKGGGAALLMLAIAMPSTGCSSLASSTKDAAHGLVDCTKGSAAKAATELGPVLEGAVVQTVANGKPDWAPLKLLAKSWTAEVGGCALAAAVGAVARASATGPKTQAQQIDGSALVSEFRSLVDERFGGATFHTAAGDL